MVPLAWNLGPMSMAETWYILVPMTRKCWSSLPSSHFVSLLLLLLLRHPSSGGQFWTIYIYTHLIEMITYGSFQWTPLFQMLKPSKPMRRWFIGSRAWSLSYAAPWRPKKVSEDVGFTRFTMVFTMDFHINLWLFMGEHGKSLSIIYHGIFTSMSFSWGNMRFLTMTFG